MKQKHLVLGVVFIAVAAIARLLPHPSNFSPVGSMALFGGAVFAIKYLKYLIPIAALYLSDFVLNNTLYRQWYPNHEGTVFFTDDMMWVYAAFLLAVVIGHFVIKKITVGNVILGAVLFTIGFFVISNFGSWMSGIMYPKTFSGLIACYTAGVPFIKFSLAGNLFYSAVLFGGYAFLTQRDLKTQLA